MKNNHLKNGLIDFSLLPYDENRVSVILKQVRLVSLIFVSIFVVFAVFGWVSNKPIFASLGVDYIPMAPSTVFSFTLLLVLFFTHYFLEEKFLAGVFFRVGVFIVLFLNAIFLLRLFDLINFDLEFLLFRTYRDGGAFVIGRISPVTASSFVFTAISALIISSTSPRNYLKKTAAFLVFLNLSAGFIVLLGYLYNAPLLYGAKIIPVALNTAIGILGVNIAVFSMFGPGNSLIRFFFEPSLHGVIIRIFAPYIVTIVLMYRFFELVASRAGVNPALTSALLIILSLAVFITIVLIVSRRVSRDVSQLVKERRAAEEEFGKIFNLSLDMICIAEINGYFKKVNPAFVKALGYSEKELLSRSFLDFVHPDDRQRTIDLFNNKLNRGEPVRNFVNRYCSSDGSCRWLEWVSHPVWEEGAMYALARDITERKTAETVLKESEKKYRNLIGSLQEGIWVIDAHNNTTFVNAKMAQMLGYRESEILGKSVFSFMDERGVENCKEQIERRKQGIEEQHDFELIKKDGNRIYVAMESASIFDDSGNYAGGIAGVIDITARKKAEEALTESESKFRSLFDQATDSIFLMSIENDDFIIVDINQAACDIHGYRREELIGKSIGVLDDPETRKYIPERAKAFTQGVTLRAEAKHIRKDGSIFPVEISAQLINIASVPYVLAIDRDISERKKSDEILQRDKETLERLVEERSRQLMDMHEELDKAKRLSDMGTVAATIAHELRNPLAAIQIAAYNIKKKCAGQLIDKHVFNIEKKVSESDQIINNLLFYARLKSAHYEKIEICDILEECISSAENHFEEKKVLVIRDLSEARGFLIDADPLQMRECFANILNNAFDAVSSKGGKIEVSVKQADNGHIEILVKDNGAGIGQENLKKVFDPFFTTKSKGTGLGLTVCSQIVYLHEGAIDIQSKNGEGTSVTVVLPFKKKEK